MDRTVGAGGLGLLKWTPIQTRQGVGQELPARLTELPIRPVASLAGDAHHRLHGPLLTSHSGVLSISHFRAYHVVALNLPILSSPPYPQRAATYDTKNDADISASSLDCTTTECGKQQHLLVRGDLFLKSWTPGLLSQVG